MQQGAPAEAALAPGGGEVPILAPGHGPYRNYALGPAYDEMFARDGAVRGRNTRRSPARLTELAPEELARRQHACEQSFLHQGITFTVYGDAQATERIIPTDLLPRIVTAAEWAEIERGLKQRITRAQPVSCRHLRRGHAR